MFPITLPAAPPAIQAQFPRKRFCLASMPSLRAGVRWCAGRAMLAIFCSATKQRSSRKLYLWPPPVKRQCSAGIVYLACTSSFRAGVRWVGQGNQV
eukprot:721091-Pelagomonas_calceolata.AAC.1